MYKISEKLVTFLDPASIEPQAMEQLQNIAEMPFVFKHVAAMPDCHLGKGATVGSVIATKGAIIPAAVGVDIGCGMIAVRTPFTSHSLPENLEAVREAIEKRIPLGAGRKNQELTPTAVKRTAVLTNKATKAYDEADWRHQLGTLGSGNHFIELSLDENDTLWVVLHSGSRGIGNRLAQKHIKIAQKLMDDYFIPLKDHDLAYLIENSPEFDSYIEDLLWAQDFALANREEMMDRVLMEVGLAIAADGLVEIEAERINCHQVVS